MFRMKLGLASAFRNLGAVMLIAGLGMIFAMPAAADDHEPVGGPGGLVPIACSYCTQQTAPEGCESNQGCLCPPSGGYCHAKIGSNIECKCQ